MARCRTADADRLGALPLRRPAPLFPMPGGPARENFRPLYGQKNGPSGGVSESGSERAGSCKKERRPGASPLFEMVRYVSAGAATPTPYAEADQCAAEKRERCRLGGFRWRSECGG
jgi:hypothetical protein